METITIPKKETTVKEVQITLPYYSKNSFLYFMVYGKGEDQTKRVSIWSETAANIDNYNNFNEIGRASCRERV